MDDLSIKWIKEGEMYPLWKNRVLGNFRATVTNGILN